MAKVGVRHSGGDRTKIVFFAVWQFLSNRVLKDRQQQQQALRQADLRELLAPPSTLEGAETTDFFANAELTGKRKKQVTAPSCPLPPPFSPLPP